MTNLAIMSKSKDITLLTEVCVVKARVFPVVMYGYESWTKKTGECQRAEAFELRSWPWIFIGRVDAETPMLWATWCKEKTHWKRPWCWERLKAEGWGSGWQRMRWLDCITDLMDMNLRKLGDSGGQSSLACCSPWHCKESDITERLNSKTYTNIYIYTWVYILVIIVEYPVRYIYIFICTLMKILG